jgi:2-dehydropantoate 2-reductase
MKICVIGAGSIGGLLAAKLARAGEEVSVIARGAHLEAIRKDGLRLIEEEGGESAVKVAATDRINDIGAQDCVILGMKAHQVAAVAADVPALLDRDATILTAQNGIPWWYFFKHGGEHEGRRLESVDPGGVIADHLPIDRIIGSVVYAAAEIVAPGVIKHSEGNRFSLAEIDNSSTPRVAALSEALKRAGFKAPVVTDIRAEIWMKLWGNLSLNPVSALTHATLEDICRYPPTRDLVARMMAEAQAIGAALGIRFRLPVEKRIAGAEAIGKHKTSMLQDIEAGRAIEIDALLGSVLELGRITGVAAPSLENVYALVKLTAKMLQEQRGRLRIEPL